MIAMTAIGLVYLWHLRRPALGARGAAAAIALVSCVAVVLMPSATTLWARLHAVSPDVAIAAEDRTGVSVLVPDGNDIVMFTNGLGDSSLPYGEVHTALGALGVLVHPAPRRIGIIGLGSGDTAFAAGGRAEVAEIDVMEIVRPIQTTLGKLEQQGRFRGLHQLLADRRVRYDFGDGRAFLRRGAGGYDVIEADALRPRTAYAGNLYSVEYFTLLRNRLAPGGLAVTWTPTERVRDTFISVFPYVLLFGDIAIGSSTAIKWDAEAVQARMRDARTSQYYQDGDVNIEAALREYLRAGPEYVDEDFDRSSLLDLNRDLFPKDEFGVARKR
jgi:spermidine synthase